MDKQEIKVLKRRDFIKGMTGLGVLGLTGYALAEEQKGKLKTTLSDKEKLWVKESVMAMDMPNYFGKGHSCAESILMVSLKHGKMPEKWVWAAAGFGGGMGQKDLCGFLTGGLIGLGFACGSLKTDSKNAKKILSQARKSFWQWWAKQAPLHCSEIRPKGSPGSICKRLSQLSAAKLEEILKTIKV